MRATTKDHLRSGGNVALAALLTLLCLYGLFSTPGLAARWGWSWPGVAVLAAGAALMLGACWQAARPIRGGNALAWAGLVVVTRIAVALIADGRVSPGDPHAYVTLARNVLAGRGYVIDEASLGIAAYAFYPPAYPLLLALWGGLLGFSTWSLLALNTLIDLGAARLIFTLGDRIGSRGAGRTAALAYLFWPSVLLSAPLAQKEGLCTLLVLMLALVWVWQAKRRIGGWQGALALGMPAGLLALAQPGEAGLAALFGIMLAWRTSLGDVLRFGLAALPVAILTLLPWWVRNALVFGAFVPLTSAAGISLWVGNNPAATGNWMPLPAEIHGLPERVASAHAAGMAKQWIAAHPAAFVRLTLTKFIRAMGAGQFGLVRLGAMTPPLAAPLAAALFAWAQFFQVGLLGLAGTALWRREMKWLAPLLLACLAQVLLLGVWFEFGERHREFLTPFLLLAIAVWLVPRKSEASA